MLNKSATNQPTQSTSDRPREPRGILITSRVNFDAAVHAPVAKHMAAQYGTKIVVFTGRPAVAAKWRQWAGPDAVIFNDEDLHVTAERALSDWNNVQAIAMEFERRYGLTYMRDILHQDKGIAAYYLQHSPQSAFARQKPAPFPFLVSLINTYFQAIEDMLAEHPIDLFLTRSSGLFNSAAVAVARKRKIPVSWLNHARVGKQMIWMEGPDHHAGLILEKYSDAASEPLPLPEDIAPPPDTVLARDASQNDDSILKLFNDLARATVIRVIMRSSDIARRSWPRRLPLHGFVAQQFTRWRAAAYLIEGAKKDARRLQKGKYVLFLLHLDPEYSSSTLARRFNHTHAIVQQLALSLPVGYTLALKEHVIGVGNRAVSFYKELGHLPNVALVDYRAKASTLARDAAAVATVWGTICLEASLLGVPVLCFTDNSEFAVLKNVRTVRSPTDIPAAVQDVLQPRSEEEVLEARRDAVRFREAQLAVSFSLSTLDLDEYGNRNRKTFGMPQAELDLATAKLLNVYRSGGGTARPIE